MLKPKEEINKDIYRLRDAICLKDFSEIIRVEPKKLSYILYKIPKANHYTRFEIPKKSAGVRVICAPNKELKGIQTRLAKLLCNICQYEGYEKKLVAYGFTKKTNSKNRTKGYSIYSNAKYHRNKKYVFNFDLKDFFPSINFGRIRGYFIKNKIFNLNEKIATIIAQIACYESQLPQGSPCSPIISNLIGHLLDIKMIQIAKKYKCTYSRYVDDITFSTNKKDFPKEIAVQSKNSELYLWYISPFLEKIVNKFGFKINHKKTRMSYRDKRQTVTGLVVNKKINIRREYYKKARAMVHHLLTKRNFNIPYQKLQKTPMREDNFSSKIIKLEGILNHINYTKSPKKIKYEDKKENENSGYKKLLRDFVFLKNFIAIDKPVIVTEGKTDITHLQLAIKKFSSEYSELISCLNTKEGKRSYKYKIKFFKDTAKNNICISGGAGGLKKLISQYEQWRKKCSGWGNIEYPVIVVLDGDEMNEATNKEEKRKLKGSKDIFEGYIKENLYLLGLPGRKSIEDLYDKKWRKKELNGKTFSKDNKNFDKSKHYGKHVFCKEVVAKNFNDINFSKFEYVLNKTREYIKSYNTEKVNKS